jgi:NADPH2:quinone reductase
MSSELRNRHGAAIVMREYGGPEVLHFEQVPLAALSPGEIRLRSVASAINHSDLEIRCGNWPIRRADPFPYTPGLEVVGEVAEIGPGVTDFAVGDRVITMMQGLGGVRALRPGGYAEYVVVEASAAAVVPAGIDPLEMAALGLASVTAFEGLRKIGSLENRRIIVTGAAGGVGSAAVAIAKAQGAQVVGIVSRAEQAPYVRSLGAADTLTPHDIANGALGAETFDGVLDAVAGNAFVAYVTALRRGGVLSLVGAVGGSNVSFDAYRLLEVTLTGYSSESLNGPALRGAIASIAAFLKAGAILAPARTLLPLSEAAAAHASLEQHQVHGRVLLIPA